MLDRSKSRVSWTFSSEEIYFTLGKSALAPFMKWKFDDVALAVPARTPARTDRPTNIPDENFPNSLSFSPLLSSFIHRISGIVSFNGRCGAAASVALLAVCTWVSSKMTPSAVWNLLWTNTICLIILLTKTWWLDIRPPRIQDQFTLDKTIG